MVSVKNRGTEGDLVNHYATGIVVNQYQSELRAQAAEQRLAAEARRGQRSQASPPRGVPTFQHRLITAVTGALR